MNDNLLNDLPRGHGKAGENPQATFETTSNIINNPSLQFSEDSGALFTGIIGGQVHERRHASGRVDRFITGGTSIGLSDDRHRTTIAGSRGGKGRACIIPVLLSQPRDASQLIIDIKGELSSICANYHASLGKTVKVYDPFKISTASAFRATFNPLSILHSESPTQIEDAALISDALIISLPHETDSHWNEAARALLEGIILHVVTHPKYNDKRDLNTVYKLLMNPSLQEELEGNTAANGILISTAYEHFSRPDRERESVMSTLRRHLRFLSYPAIQDVLCDPSIDLRELKKQPMTIYLCLPAMRMATCYRWFRLFLNLTLAAMEREHTRPPHHILMVLDEAFALGHSRQLEVAMGQLAGFNVKIWSIWQSLGQIKSTYKDNFEIFLSNSGELQIFALNDETSLAYVSKMLGSTTVENFSQNEVSFTDRTKGVSGRSSNIQTQPLLHPHEISQYFGREDHLLRQLILRSGSKPMILQRAFYDKHELFQGKFDAPNI